MGKFLTDLLTGIDGATWDIGRVAFGLGVLTFIGSTIAVVVQGQAFGYQDFGIGFGSLLGGGGLGLMWKAKTEPGHNQNDKEGK